MKGMPGAKKAEQKVLQESSAFQIHTAAPLFGKWGWLLNEHLDVQLLKWKTWEEGTHECAALVRKRNMISKRKCVQQSSRKRRENLSTGVTCEGTYKLDSGRPVTS